MINQQLSSKTILAIVLGNALEWYDFVVYSFMIIYIAPLFFPSHDHIISLLSATATFGVAFCMRPLGGVVLGMYADRYGRKAALTVIISLMLVAVLMICFTPTYQQVGILAPFIMLLARLLQGFSTGGEFGVSTALLIELSPLNQRGYYCSWQQTSQVLAIILGAGVAAILTLALSTDQLATWGWRVPFFVGLIIAPVGLYIRRQHIDETDKPYVTSKKLGNELLMNLSQLFIAMGLVVGGTVATYINFLYMPTYAVKQLALPLSSATLSLFMGMIPMLLAIPFVGWLSDRIGKKRILLVSILLYLLSVYPLFAWLCSKPTMMKLMVIQLICCLLLSAYFGVFAAILSELFPKEIRGTALSISYNMGAMLFGGFAQFIVTWLIMVAATPMAITYYLLFAIFVSLIAALFYNEKGMSCEYS